MSASLVIGRTALQASQLALQVAGNNIANANTIGYSRQRANLVAVPGQSIGPGVFLGRGIGVDSIRRIVDPALTQRVRSAVSDEAAAGAAASILSSIESVTNELTDNDISSRLTDFFNAFSELANNPAQSVTRAAVLETAGRLTQQITSVRSDVLEIRDQIDRKLKASTEEVNKLLDQVAVLNNEIVSSELGAGENSTLRDQRDAKLAELSQLMDIAIVPRDDGQVNVFVGSEPLIDGNTVRDIQFRQRTNATTGEIDTEIVIKEDQTRLDIDGGEIGGLLAQRVGPIDDNLQSIDNLASTLIFEVNKMHSRGRPDMRLTSVTATREVSVPDQALAINDPTNAAFNNLPFSATNGSFPVVITDSNGNRVIETIEIDLDGIDATGNPGFADDTSLADIATAINAISPNISASFGPEGNLQISTAAGYDVSFAYLQPADGTNEERIVGDTSGVLAVLGINSVFTGTDGRDIAVRQELRDEPQLLAIGAGAGTNETALALASLRDMEMSDLGNASIADSWQQRVEANAVATAGANARFESLATVRQSLEAQEQGISGVSLDEESINLITYQQQYNGAARFISLVDELNTVLLSLV